MSTLKRGGGTSFKDGHLSRSRSRAYNNQQSRMDPMASSFFDKNMSTPVRAASVPPNLPSNLLMDTLHCGHVRKYRVDFAPAAEETGGVRAMVHPGRLLPAVMISTQSLFGSAANKCGSSGPLKRLSAGVPVEAPRFLTHDVFPMSSSAFSNFRETRTRFQPAAPRTVSRGFLSDNTENFPQHIYDGYTGEPGKYTSSSVVLGGCGETGQHNTAVYTGASAVRPGYVPSRQAVRESTQTAKRVLNARQAHRTGRFKGGPYV